MKTLKLMFAVMMMLCIPTQAQAAVHHAQYKHARTHKTKRSTKAKPVHKTVSKVYTFTYTDGAGNTCISTITPDGGSTVCNSTRSQEQQCFDDGGSEWNTMTRTCSFAPTHSDPYPGTDPSTDQPPTHGDPAPPTTIPDPPIQDNPPTCTYTGKDGQPVTAPCDAKG